MIGIAQLAGLLLPALSPEGPVEFNRDIRPILSDKCFSCHGPDANKRKAKLRLDVREIAVRKKAIVPGNPDGSELIARIFHHDPEERMPPRESERTLNRAQMQLLRTWILEGAKYQDHWAYLPPKRLEVPQDQHPVDGFIARSHRDHGLAFSPEADRTTLIRRVTLDLTGLPPTPAEVDAFLVDQRPDAYARLVDRLLDSPRYGEAMALTWLDAARYADTDGYQNDGPRSMWRWRDWVIEAYNRNLPFDRFTIEQLAGDLLPNPTLDQHIATGFNRNHRYNSEAGLVLEEFRLENAVDRVDTTATVWMGLTLGCARCHDHKYDPFSTEEYYRLIAFFDKVPESGRAVKFGNSEPWVIAPTREQLKKQRELEQAVKRAEVPPDGLRVAAQAWAKSLEQPVYRPVIDRNMTRAPLNAPDKKLKAAAGSVRFAEAALQLGGKDKVNTGLEANTTCQSRFTVSFHIKPAAPNGVILSNQGGGTTRPGLAVELKDRRLQFYVVTRWISGVGMVETAEPLRLNQGTQVTLVNDGSQSATGMDIWLDGKQAATRIGHNTNSNTGGRKGPLFAGGGVIGEGYQGLIKDLRFYGRSLFDDEIAAIAGVDREPAAFLRHGGHAEYTRWDEARFKARMELRRFVDGLPTSMVMKHSDAMPATTIRKRGIYNNHGGVVEPGTPARFPAMDPGLPRNRLGFAKWLVSGEHPLTARVAVNRYWQRYFGTGLVKTAEDFGVQGELPSHPELLDWLAGEFVRSGWDIKAMQKLLVTSRTYRQDARLTPELLRRDPGNRRLARGPRFRLPAHVVRDQALAVSGLLVEQQGGPSVSPYQPKNLWKEMSNMTYRQSKGGDLYRRSLYTIWKRTVLPPSMAVLDAADRENCAVLPKRTNTPLQALTLLNETAFVEAARKLGERLLTEGGEDPVRFGFRTVAAREPNPKEHALLREAFKEYREDFAARPEDAKKLLKTGSSPAAKDLDPVELAAAATLANVLLNLDEVITKE